MHGSSAPVQPGRSPCLGKCFGDRRQPRPEPALCRCDARTSHMANVPESWNVGSIHARIGTITPSEEPVGHARHRSWGLGSGAHRVSLLERSFRRSRRWDAGIRCTIPVLVLRGLRTKSGLCDELPAIREVKMDSSSFMQIYHPQVIESTCNKCRVASSVTAFVPLRVRQVTSSSFAN